VSDFTKKLCALFQRKYDFFLHRTSPNIKQMAFVNQINLAAITCGNGAVANKKARLNLRGAKDQNTHQGGFSAFQQ
jgi:hypothetical protein